MEVLLERKVKRPKNIAIPKKELELLLGNIEGVDYGYEGPGSFMQKGAVLQRLARYYADYIKEILWLEARERGAGYAAITTGALDDDPSKSHLKLERIPDMTKKIYDAEYEARSATQAEVLKKHGVKIMTVKGRKRMVKVSKDRQPIPELIRMDLSALPDGGAMRMKEAEKFVAEVLKSKLWKDARKNAPMPAKARPQAIAVKALRNVGKTADVAGLSVGNKAEIQLSQTLGGMTKAVIIHELAHQAGYGNHGRGFRQMQVLLMAKFGGKFGLAAARQLHRKYVAAGYPVMLSEIPEVLSWEQWVRRQIASWTSQVARTKGKNQGVYAGEAMRREIRKGTFNLTMAEKRYISDNTNMFIWDAPDGRMKTKVDLEGPK